MMPYRLARLVITDIDLPKTVAMIAATALPRLNLIFRSSRPFLTLASASEARDNGAGVLVVVSGGRSWICCVGSCCY
jgi:hypothetical protein